MLGSGYPDSPPLACIFGTSRLYSTCIPPVSHRILGIPLYPCIFLNLVHLTILQQIHCIPLYLTASSCICTYLAISSCIPLYLTVSHRLENGTWPTVHSRGGLPTGTRLHGMRSWSARTPLPVRSSRLLHSRCLVCMYVCKYSAAPAHARARAHRPAAPRQSSGVSQTPQPHGLSAG